MFDLSLQSLAKKKEQAEIQDRTKKIAELARQFYDVMATDEQLKFEDAMKVVETLRGVLAQTGTTYLNSKYLNHIKQ